MKKPEPDFSHDDILATLTDMLGEVPEGNGLTTQEIASRLGVNDRKIQLMLKQLKDRGRLKVYRAYRPRIDGILCKVSTYSITAPTE